MAIKDIFTMIKADRYTQDGREELIKAQEAVTEDVTYKPGDISRKTGLQKQPDGSWAPVKNAPAQKKGLGGKTLTKGAKHYPTVGEYAENGPIEQRMAMKKLLEKNDTESGSGVPTQGSDWMSLPSGTRMTFEGAKEKMAQNSQRIEALKKSMEGKSFADNFRAGIELKKLENENEYIAERLPREMRESPSASGSLREQTPAIRAKEESITANEADKFYGGFGLKKTGEHVDSKGWTVKEYKNEAGETWTGKFNKEGKYVGSEYVPSSGSAPSASSDWKSDLVSKLDTEKLKQMDNDFKEFEKSSRNISPEAKERNDLVKAELAKRGETVTKMSDLVAQKSRPESAPSGRQPTPEMLERDKMRHSPEFQARRDKLDAEHPRTETGAPKDVKSMSISELKEQRDKLKSGSGPENDAQYKKINDELTRKRLQTLSVGSEVKAHGTPLKITSINPDTNTIRGEFDHNGEKISTTIGLEDIDDYDNITESGGSAPSELKIQGMNKEEYIPWRMKTYKENEAQASSVWNHFAEQQKNKGKENGYDPDFHPLRDSAPRVLTGDCKVRIRKSK